MKRTGTPMGSRSKSTGGMDVLMGLLNVCVDVLNSGLKKIGYYF